MRPSRVLSSILVVGVCAGIGLLPCTSRVCHAQVYEVWPTSYLYSTSYVLPSSYYVPSYYSTAYYPTYYSTGYYSPRYYSTAYYPSAYYYPTYYSTGYYPTYYSSSYYLPTSYYYPSAYYYPTYYSTGYYSTGYYYPTYYPSSYYYYPTTYYATGYYLGANDRESIKDRPATQIATKGRNQKETDRSSDRTLIASRDSTHRLSPEGDESGRDRADKSLLVKRTTYTAAANSLDDQRSTPALPSKSLPAGASGSGAAKPDSAKSGSGSAEKKGRIESTPKNTEEPALEPAPPLDRAPTRRDSLRPRYETSMPRNVLLGRVESEAGEAREGVRVTVSSRTEPGLARIGESNAFGKFAIRVGDGEWTVRVTMPSGRAYAVRQISVQDGRIVDAKEGRDIPNLIISY